MVYYAENIDTIAAIATPMGRGGIGIVRISGPAAGAIAKKILGHLPKPRYAEYANFMDDDKQIIDQGIAIYFPKPHSFTGDDVLELQGHGGPVILDCLLKRVIALGARLARPGEFSERAFLNGKLDLAQAEAISDLIEASSTQAAYAAMRSLQGEFSAHIHELVEDLIHLRAYVEAAIDFAEEEIDFLSEKHIGEKLAFLLRQVQNIQRQAQQGVILKEGMHIVIAGFPNVGKSSLLNALSERDSAIVTAIAGTTRDVLHEHIQIDGIPLHVTDTAGLRESADPIEQEGIQRAIKAVKQADRILLMTDQSTIDTNNLQNLCATFLQDITFKGRLTIIQNKIDLSEKKPQLKMQDDIPIISLSAKTREGLSLLRQHLKECIGFNTTTEGGFSARRRHLEALAMAEQALLNGQHQLHTQRAGELLAEELRQAQQALNSITGEFSSDDLLGKIFSSFCIGK